MLFCVQNLLYALHHIMGSSVAAPHQGQGEAAPSPPPAPVHPAHNQHQSKLAPIITIQVRGGGQWCLDDQ